MKKTLPFLVLGLTLVMLSACAPVATEAPAADMSAMPQWYRDALLFVGLFVGLTPVINNFMLYSALTFQVALGLLTLLGIWIPTVLSRPSKEAFKYGFYVAALATVMVTLLQGWMMARFFPISGSVIFIVEIICGLLIGFPAVGGAFKYRGAIEETSAELSPDGKKITESKKRTGPQMEIGRKHPEKKKKNKEEW